MSKSLSSLALASRKLGVGSTELMQQNGWFKSDKFFRPGLQREARKYGKTVRYEDRIERFYFVESEKAKKAK